MGIIMTEAMKNSSPPLGVPEADQRGSGRVLEIVRTYSPQGKDLPVAVRPDARPMPVRIKDDYPLK